MKDIFDTFMPPTVIIALISLSEIREIAATLSYLTVIVCTVIVTKHKLKK